MNMTDKNPEYDVYLPIWDKAEPWFEFSEGQRQTFVGNTPWRMALADKKKSVHAQASGCDAIINVYSNAIVVGGPAGTNDSVSNGVLMILVSLVGAVMGGIALYDFRSSFLAFFALPLFVPSIYCLSFFVRITFFSFRDLPALFNRSSQTVTITKPRPISLSRFWQPGKIDRVVTYSWSAVQARTYKSMQMMGETSRESYNLTLLCAEPDSPRSFKDFTYIGHVETWEDATLWRLWEHIRRYMEEDGQPLQPGETLRTSGTGKLPKFPQHLIDAAGGEALSIREIEHLTGFDHRGW